MAYRPVWAMCAIISLLVHLVGWTIEAGAQHKVEAKPTDAEEGEGDSLLRTDDGS